MLRTVLVAAAVAIVALTIGAGAGVAEPEPEPLNASNVSIEEKSVSLVPDHPPHLNPQSGWLYGSDGATVSVHNTSHFYPLWTKGLPFDPEYEAIPTPPLVTEDYVVVSDGKDFDSNIYALNRSDTTIEWVQTTDSGAVEPVIVGDTVLGGNVRGLFVPNANLTAYDLHTGDKRWALELSGSWESLHEAGNTVYAHTDEYLYSIDAPTQAVNWKVKAERVHQVHVKGGTVAVYGYIETGGEPKPGVTTYDRESGILLANFTVNFSPDEVTAAVWSDQRLFLRIDEDQGRDSIVAYNQSTGEIVFSRSYLEETSHLEVIAGVLVRVTNDGRVQILSAKNGAVETEADTEASGAVDVAYRNRTFYVGGGEERIVTVGVETIGGGPPVVGASDLPPQDFDDDGLYEDVNGDGRANVIDVGVFLGVFDSTTVTEHRTAFDFNGDGEISILDVAALLTEL
jgi:outer membrane protein assembly factor BamB